MNKKIYKGYELAQAVDNGILNLEQKVKSADNMTYYDCTIDFVLKDVAKNIIFENFKLIEDNTEEIEEKSNFEDMGYEIAQAYFEFYKGIAKALIEKRKESEDKQ